MDGEAPSPDSPGILRRDPLLVALALASGVVDAISLAVLGVFTAAISANVVFVGIALGDGDPHTAARSALAIAGFVAGVLGGAAVMRRPVRRLARAPVVLAGIAMLQAAFLTGWLVADGRPEGIGLDLLAIASAAAMGGQTAVAVSWRPDVTTTYVTGTLTVLVGELVASSGTRAARARQLGVILAVAVGATTGSLLLEDARLVVAALPLAITLGVAAGGLGIARRPQPSARSRL